MNNRLERFKHLPILKQKIIAHLFNEVSRYPRDRWHTYKGEFIYENKTYNLEATCKWDNQMFTYKNFYIEHQQQVIDIDELMRKGWLQ